MSLSQLSENSGVSKAMLSKVERGEKSPTIGIAKRIAHALDTSLSFLSGGEEEARVVAVVHKAQRPVFRDPETGFERHVLSPLMAGSNVEVVYHHLPAGVSTGKLPAYPAATEKYVVVARGTVTVGVRGANYPVTEGDTLFFEADVEHSFDNQTSGAAEYYLFICRCD